MTANKDAEEVCEEALSVSAALKQERRPHWRARGSPKMKQSPAKLALLRLRRGTQTFCKRRPAST